MKKLFSTVAATLAMSVLVACGTSAAPSSAPVTSSGTTSVAPESSLSGKIIFATNRTDIADTTLRELADQFMAENPGTEIEVESVKDGPQTLAPRLAAGEAPDIFFDFGIKLSDWSRYMMPLDDLGYTEENAMVARGSDGHIYFLPCSVMYTALNYNKTVFDDLGIEAPKTLDDFYAACETIKNAGITPFASNFKEGWPMQMFQFAYIPAKTGNGEWIADWVAGDVMFEEGGAMLEGLEILNTLKERGYLEPDLTSTNWDQFQMDFAQGKIAMVYLGTWIDAQFEKNGMNPDDIGVIPFPGTTCLDASGDTHFGISKDTENPELAKAFLKFLWEDSKYANACNVVSPLRDAEITDPYITKLLDSGLPVLQIAPAPEEWTSITSEMKLNWGAMNQEYLLAEDKQAVIDDYNKKFVDAKAVVNAE